MPARGRRSRPSCRSGSPGPSCGVRFLVFLTAPTNARYYAGGKDCWPPLPVASCSASSSCSTCVAATLRPLRPQLCPAFLTASRSPRSGYYRCPPSRPLLDQFSCCLWPLPVAICGRLAHGYRVVLVFHQVSLVTLLPWRPVKTHRLLSHIAPTRVARASRSASPPSGLRSPTSRTRCPSLQASTRRACSVSSCSGCSRYARLARA